MIPYYLGGPFWSFNEWKGSFYSKKASQDQFLEQYASVFNTVEAGSTFYAFPKAESVKKWRAAVPDSFRFIFKIPKLITHQLKLQNCQKELGEFLTLMEPVVEVTGMFQIQLSPGFSADYFTELEKFLEKWPQEIPAAVEVRHKSFFDSGENEQKLNDLLLNKSVTRMHFNTEALFRKKADTMQLQESQSKKPQSPDRWSVTTPTPAVRFISCDDLNESLKDADKLLQATSHWLSHGLKPYVLLHSPGNVITPELCRIFHKKLMNKIGTEELNKFPAEKDFQPNLFDL
jgi:uncharacterized protein YecE (DUF72 family)